MTPNAKQKIAIDECDSNILVSSSAGTGKTGVLSGRVIRILHDYLSKKTNKKGTLSRLLILTFTEAAAHNMAVRIKGELKKYPELESELKLVDSADICTFDSFYQKIVRKYFYLLGIKETFEIIDESVLKFELRKLIDSKFDELYDSNNQLFLNLLDHYTLKDDETIRDLVENVITSSLVVKIGSNSLEEMKDKFLSISEAELDEAYCFYLNRLRDSLHKMQKLFLDNYSEPALKPKRDIVLNNLKRIDEIGDHLDKLVNLAKIYQINPDTQKTPAAKWKDAENPDIRAEFTFIKEDIDSIVKVASNFPTYQEAKNVLKDNEKLYTFFYSICLEVMDKFNSLKLQKGVYTFSDIASLALHLLENNDEVRREISDSYDEIMVDEYQDNADIQERFLELIGNNNLFMVGDIKQSIYAFRNSNPTYFLNRYNQYKNGNGGKLVEMSENYRSSKSVIDTVNSIFSTIMTEDFGGANYADGHCLEQPKVLSDPNLGLPTKFLTYTMENTRRDLMSPDKEARIVCEDILQRVRNKEIIKGHPARFSDFCILIDRGTKFEDISKVFAEYQIPLNVENDSDAFSKEIVYVVKNLFLAMAFVCLDKVDTAEFKRSILCLLRSPLYREDNAKIFSYFSENKLKDSAVYKKLLSLKSRCQTSDVYSIYSTLIKEFNVYASLKNFTEVSNSIKLLSDVENQFISMAKMGYSFEDVIAYFQRNEKDKSKLKVRFKSPSNDAVNITNIHKSKGLEYPVVYCLSLYNKYKSIKEDDVLFDRTNGVQFKYTRNDQFDAKEGDVYTNPILAYRKDIIALQEKKEKIRLLYVQLTRAEQQLVFVAHKEEGKEWTAKSIDKCNSFADLLAASKYPFNEEKANLDGKIDSGYKNDAESDAQQDKAKEIKKITLKYSEPNFIFENPVVIRASKKETHTSKAILDLGSKLHEAMEITDFENPDYSLFKDKDIVSALENFINSDIYKENKRAEIYKEYRYYDEDNNSEGSIDLLFIHPDHFVIVDYKFSNLSDSDYIKQIEIYADNVRRIFNLSKGSGYLYSLKKGVFKKVL